MTQLGLQTPRPSAGEIIEAIRPILSRHFKPALLARMQIVPFYPLMPDALAQIVRLKLDKVGKRLQDNQKIAFHYSDAVAAQIVARCTEVETGARNIDHIVNKTLLPQIATEILTRMNSSEPTTRLVVDVAADGAFTYRFDDPSESKGERAAA
jgi:type VI secretion system protein VasG